MLTYICHSIGWGRKNRAAAICRHIPDSIVVTNPGPSNAPLDWWGVDWVSPTCTKGRTTHQSMLSTVRELNPSVIVTDVNPYGYPQGFVRRFLGRVPVVFIRRNDPHTPQFDPDDFAAVIDVDESPVLAHDPEDLPTRGEARTRLGGGDRPLIAVVGSLAHDGSELTVPPGADVVRFDRYPVMPDLVGVDAVVSHAGLNIINETLALGIPGLHIATDVPDQPARANGTPDDIAGFAARATVLDRPDDWRPTYVNHARDIAARIAALA